MALLAAAQAPELVGARLPLRSRGYWGVRVGVPLAAPSDMAMLLPGVRFTADRASRASPASLSRVTPLPAPLAHGDTRVGSSGANEIFVTADVDALVDQAPRASS